MDDKQKQAAKELADLLARKIQAEKEGIDFDADWFDKQVDADFAALNADNKEPRLRS